MAARDRRMAKLEKQLLGRLDEVIHNARNVKLGHLRDGYKNLAIDDQGKIDALEAERDALLRRMSGKAEVIAFDSGSRLKSA